MFYAKHRSRRKKMKFVKGIAMLLCLVTIFTSVWVGNLGIGAEDGDDKVTVTVKYVYKSNGYMVTQPYTAQISKGTDFTKTIEIPHLLNYTIPVDDAIVSVGSDGMSLQGYAGISLNEKDSTISFDLKAVTEDVAVTLYYVAGKGKYTVNHYRQNLENDEYTLDRSDIVVNGDIDAYTEAVADIVPGYHCKGVEQSTIAADGTTKVDIYYDRDFYTVVFDVNGGVNGPKPIYAKFGTTFEADSIQKPTREGYTFLGWSPVLSDTVTIEKNITYVAQWQAEKGQADYTIVLWGQNANDDEYSYLSSHEAWGNVGKQVTWNEGTLISHDHGTENGENCNGAEFYYRRNNYNLEFYSASKSIADKFEKVKYQNPLGGYDYTPVNKPDTVENDAVFVGWYLNPECTGEKYDLSAHTMPAHDIALYAKWVNGLYTVTTYTDESKSELYTYEGYEGVQTNIVKYTLAEAPKDPEKSGYVFAGWFYNDGEKEEPFSFTMPITRNYNLYPKFTDQVMVNYTVHYYIENSTTKVAEDDGGQARIGSSVTIKAKMGTELYSGMQNNFFPNLTSTSVTIEKDNQEIIIYYRAAQEVEYTVKYQDKNGKDLISSVKKKTKDAIVTEKYVPIPNYAPRQDSIRFELKAEGNVIVFIYDPTLTTLNIRKTGFDAADAGTTFIFRIKGTDGNTKNIDLRVTIHGYVMGDHVPNVTVADLPVGSYTVTEESGWSWRYQPKNGEQTITLDPDGTKNVLTFENERKDGQWLSGDAYNNNLYKPDSN